MKSTKPSRPFHALPALLCLCAFFILHSAFYISRAAAQTAPNNNPIEVSGSSITFDNARVTTSFADRGGTFAYHDLAFTNNGRAAAAINLSGYTASGTLWGNPDPQTAAHRVTLTGTNLLIATTTTAYQALALRDGATAILRDTIITQTQTGTAANSSATNNTTEAILITDTAGQRGSHLYADGIAITVQNTRAIAIGQGANTVTLKNGTLDSTANAAAITFHPAGDTTERAVALENFAITTTGSNAPALHYVGDYARFSLTSGTITTTGDGSPALRLVNARNTQVNNGVTTYNSLSKFDAEFRDATITSLAGAGIDINYDPMSAAYGQRPAEVARAATSWFEGVYDIRLYDTTLAGALAAIRLAASGSAAAPFYTNVNLFLYDSTLNGAIQMLAGDNTTYSSGVRLALTGSSSTLNGDITLDGNAAASRSHQAIITLENSAINGTLRSATRGEFHLRLTDTPISGALALSGSSLAFLDLARSAISGGIALADNATLNGTLRSTTISNALTATGAGVISLSPDNSANGITATGASFLSLSLDASTIAGGINATDNAALTLTLENASAITGGVTLSGSAALTITLRDPARSAASAAASANSAASTAPAATARFSRLEGDITIADRATFALAAATASTTPVTLSNNLSLAGTWLITTPIRHTGALTLTDPRATIAISNAATDSLTLANGLTGAGRLDILSIDGSTLGAPEIRVIHDETNTFTTATTATTAPLRLSRPVDYGLAAYTLQNRPDGAWLVGGLSGASYGSGGAAVFNTQALAAEDWFASLAPAQRHLEQLRAAATFMGSAGVPPADEGRPDPRPERGQGQGAGRTLSADGTPALPKTAAGDAGSLWLVTSAATTRVSRDSAALTFTQRAFSIAAGADTRWDLDASTLTTGIYAATTRTLRDFTATADASTITVGAALYAQWHHRNGLHLAAIGRLDTHKNALDTHVPNNALSADYNTQTQGLSLEAGWRLAHPRTGWWIEPTLQFAAAKFPSVAYTTRSNKPANIIPISIADARATQTLLTLALGKPLNENWSLSARVAAARVATNGGAFTAPNLTRADFTISGNRLETALTLERRIGPNTRLTLDAAHVAARDYNRPLTITLGYLHLW